MESVWFRRNRRLSQATKDSYFKWSFKKYLRFFAEAYPASELAFELFHLNHWVDQMDDLGLSAASIQLRVIRALRVAVFAMDENLVPRSHIPRTRSVDLAKVVHSFGPVLQREDYCRFFSTTPQRAEPGLNSTRSKVLTLRDDAFVQLAANLPDFEFRDLLAITTEDLELDSSSVRVRGHLSRLSPDTVHRLTTYRASVPTRSDYVFATYTGTPW